MNFSEKILRSILNPGTVLKHVWRKFPVGSFELRMKFDAFHKPSYAYGVYRASMLAKKLGLKRISVIEFGVSRGYGLLALEEIAAEVENIFDITIDVIGFDTGAGLVPVVDYRDMPYEWETGEFRMDVDALKEKLKKARLVLGDVAHTIAQEMPSFEHSPIGFISFDLDLYTSTMSAFKILDGNEKTMLPRIYSYFDDVYNPASDCSDYTGELLAINDFNATHPHAKITKAHGLTLSWNLRSVWTEGFYIIHNFSHSLYSTNTHKS